MAIVDSRGRVFGRINLIDFFVAVFAVVLVPLAYGGYLLFRIPPPRIISVAPTTVPFTTNTEQRLEITAEHLRPYLRAKIGTNSARSFEADSASHGEVKFGDLPVGVHDLILYDESQEIARLPNALTIEPAPLQRVGTLSAGGDALRPGAAFGPPERPIAELLRVDEGAAPEKRRAVVRVKCQLAAQSECNVGGVRVRAGASLELPTASGRRT